MGDGPDPSDGFWPPTSDDIALGVLRGHRPDLAEPLPTTTLSPSAALEQRLAELLARPPFVVLFSGGQDSSLVLAMAARVARQEGLPLPVALTRRYPDHPDTSEEEWQELVVRFARIADWVKVDHHDELDLLGPVAAGVLRRWGVPWPPLLHVATTAFPHAGGGTLVTGEGGDEYLGGQRSAGLAYLVARRGRVRPRRAAGILAATVRARQITDIDRPWLRPAAQARLTADHPLGGNPLRWDRSIDRLWTRRGPITGIHNLGVVAAAAGVAMAHPLMEASFVAAVRRAGGWLGWTSRQAALVSRFPGELPDAVARRRTKASFVAPSFGPYTRAFARSWDGSGVDHEVVDPEALVAEWTAAAPNPGTTMLLQAAWLAARARGTEDQPPAATRDP